MNRAPLAIGGALQSLNRNGEVSGKIPSARSFSGPTAKKAKTEAKAQQVPPVERLGESLIFQLINY